MEIKDQNKMGNNKGFTLIELAIVVLVFGLITGAFFSYLTVKTSLDKYDTTVKNQQKVARAFSTYVRTYGSLPCPGRTAPPGGHEHIGEPNMFGCAAAADRIGIVPFRVLGLTQNDTIDGYGRPFTYAVSEKAIAPITGDVHNYCRRTTVWVSGTNKNSLKAHFCCQMVPDANALSVLTSASGSAWITTQGASPAAGDFAPETTAVATAPASQNIVRYIAYVLVSHGQNGFGAKAFGTNSTMPTTAASADEVENANGDRVFVDRGRAEIGYDDIVLWRTQEQVVSELKDDMCARP